MLQQMKNNAAELDTIIENQNKIDRHVLNNTFNILLQQEKTRGAINNQQDAVKETIYLALNSSITDLEIKQNQSLQNITDVLHSVAFDITNATAELNTIERTLTKINDKIDIIVKDHECESGFCFELSMKEMKDTLAALLGVQSDFSAFMQPVAAFITGDLTAILVDYYNPVSILGGFHTKPKDIDKVKTEPDMGSQTVKTDPQLDSVNTIPQIGTVKTMPSGLVSTNLTEYHQPLIVRVVQ